MQKVLLLLIVQLCISRFCLSQNTAIEQFYLQHQSLHNAQNVEENILPIIRQYNQDHADDNSKIEKYRIIEHLGPSKIAIGNIMDLIKVLQKNQYETLFKVNESQTSAFLMVKEISANSFSELLFLKRDPESFLLISLSGILDMKHLFQSIYPLLKY